MSFVDGNTALVYPPKWIRDLNYIAHFWFDPCHAPMTVYVETLVPSAGQMLLQIFGFDFNDYAKAKLRPNVALSKTSDGLRLGGGVRSARHGRGARRGMRGINLPDVSNDLGRSQNAMFGPKKADISAGTRFLWRLDPFLERPLFWWNVIDALNDFQFNWASALHKSGFCQFPFLGGMKSVTDGHSGDVGDIWHALPIFNLEWQNGGAFTPLGNAWGQLPRTTIGCTVMGKLRNPSQVEQAPVQLRFRGGPSNAVATSGVTVLQPLATEDVGFHCNLHDVNNVVPEIHCFPGGVDWLFGHLTIHSYQD